METPSIAAPKPLTLPRCPLEGGWGELPLGRAADEEIARDLRARGITVGRSTITRARHALDIPTFVPPPKEPKTTPPKRARIPWKRLPLGVIFDALLAKHLGVTHPAVLHQRRVRSIPPAPRSLDNLLLGLIQRQPGLHLRSYCAKLDSDEHSTQRSLKSLLKLGLVEVEENSLYPVFLERTRQPRSLSNPLTADPKPASSTQGAPELPCTTPENPAVLDELRDAGWLL